MNHWLMKTEPEEFSIADLAKRGREPWTGVRNPIARNHMRAMSVDDAVLFYHSSCTPPGVAGLARVCVASHADPSQFDRASKYHDPRSTPAVPRWDCVDVEYVETFATFVSLDRIRADAALADMVLVRNSRLSVQPVTPAEYRRIVALGRRVAPADKPENTEKAAKAANGVKAAKAAGRAKARRAG